jgi:hypothetical protein
MRRQPPTFQAITCRHQGCGAIVALISPGALVYDTKLRCPLCGVVSEIKKVVDISSQEMYTRLHPA